MQVIELRCPHCTAKLRLRDHSFVGRVVHCPDCTRPIAIDRDAAGGVQASLAPPDPVPAHPRQPSVQSLAAAEPAAAHTSLLSAALLRSERRPRATPARIAWGVAGLLVLTLLYVAWSGREEAATTQPSTRRPKPGEAVPMAPHRPDNVAPVKLPAGAPLPPANLQRLGDLVTAYREGQSRFPFEQPQSRSLPAEERLGWLAVLAAQSGPTGPQPQWDRPLLDPLNSRFVRRRMPEYLNPLLADAAVEGLPATHFVGVAGVGTDAAQLAKSHPRAGTFGFDRQTTVDDVRDGLSNTLLIVGASARPAPWAAGGERTIRPLTQAPYVHGPDGFGTGQSDGMFVLLADGSTKFLSAATDPTIFRRMAAMADGWPLDAAVVGEPGDRLPAAPTAPQDVPDQPPAEPAPSLDPAQSDRPILPELAAERIVPLPPDYDVERALSQPIVKFSQSRPLPFRELLPLLEDLAGVPVQVDPPDSAALSRPVTLELSETTVGDILAALARQTGLAVDKGRAFGVRLHAAP